MLSVKFSMPAVAVSIITPPLVLLLISLFGWCSLATVQTSIPSEAVFQA
jgi:hypothetical protein